MGVWKILRETGCVLDSCVHDITLSGKLLYIKSTYHTINTIFWPLVPTFEDFLAIFTLFGAFCLCNVGAFLAIFPILLGFVGIFWGTPANYFADFGQILGIFDHFLTILGHIIFFAFFDPKTPKNKVCGCVEVLGEN